MMEKQPLIGSGVNPSCNEKFNTGIFITNSSSKFNVAGSSNFHSSGNEANLEVESLNDSSTEIREGLNAGNFTNITAHFNPAFEKSGGVNIPITNSMLDPGKHSAISFKGITHKKEKGILANPVRGRLGEGIPVLKEKHGGMDSNGRSSRKSSNPLRGRPNSANQPP